MKSLALFLGAMSIIGLAQSHERCDQDLFPVLAEEGDCQTYFACLDGEVQLLQCPIGELFDTEISSCNLRHLVRNCPLRHDHHNHDKCDKDNERRMKEKSHCKKYLVCEKKKLHEKSCPPRQLFNDKTKKCDWEELVDCNDDNKDHDKCDKDNERRVKEKSHCKKYLVCEKKKLHEKSCPPHQLFNDKTKKCDWEELVDCDDDNKDKECPKPEGTFPLAGSKCTSYVECRKGKAKHHKCPHDRLYNEHNKKCDWWELVTCKDGEHTTNKPTATPTRETPTTTEITTTPTPTTTVATTTPTPTTTEATTTAAPTTTEATTSASPTTTEATTTTAPTTTEATTTASPTTIEATTTATPTTTEATTTEATTTVAPTTTEATTTASPTTTEATTTVAPTTTEATTTESPTTTEATTTAEPTTTEATTTAAPTTTEATTTESPTTTEPTTTASPTTTETTFSPSPSTPRGCDFGDPSCEPDEVLCPEEFGYFPHPDDQGLFLNCDRWRPYIMKCPAGLHFDAALKVCTWPK